MWGDGKRCAVLLGFDFDAETMWEAVNMATPTPLSRGTYGADVGVPRVLDLLDKHGIPATFFIPAATIRRHIEVAKAIRDRGHEIGHHGDYHESPVKVTRDEEKRVLSVGFETMGKALGVHPKGYRSPAWDLSENSAQLFEEFGFVWDSSMMGNDFAPYYLKDGDRQTKIVEIPVSWELDDAPHFHFNFFPMYFVGLSAPSKVFEIWASEFDGAYATEGVYVLTMHPQLIGRWHRLQMLDRLIRYMRGHPGVWFATFSEIADEWLRRNA
jgi:peptidoglycan-N-acetylglucosamine deacetylase